MGTLDAKVVCCSFVLALVVVGSRAVNDNIAEFGHLKGSEDSAKDALLSHLYLDFIPEAPRTNIPYSEYFSNLFRYGNPEGPEIERNIPSYEEQKLYTKSVEDMMKALASPSNFYRTTKLLKADGVFNDLETCAQDVNTLFALSANKTLWAQRMVDSWGKPGAGIVLGGKRFLGEYDECMDTTPVNVSFDRHYCLHGMGIQKIGNTTYKKALGFQMGICAPSTCNAQNLTVVLNALLLSLQPDITMGAGGGNCLLNELELSDKAINVIIVCGFFIAAMVFATLYDVAIVRGHWKLLAPRPSNKIWLYDRGPNESLGEEKTALIDSTKKQDPAYTPGVLGKTLLSFSVYTNGGKLLSTKTGGGTIECINGIRFFSMSWVILGHAFSMGNGGVANVKEYREQVTPRWTFQAIANALVSVDSFFTLSGLLVMYLVMKELTAKKGPSKSFFFHFYFHRFWRLTPPYMLVMMLHITIFQYLGDGPVWPQQGMEAGKDDCEDVWWTNLLYVNNLVDNKKMCMGWSWYLANDMQFFVISPMIFLPVFYFKWKGLLVAFVMLVGNAIASGVITMENNLAPNTFSGIPGGGDYFHDYYIVPYTRIGPYIIGMIAGYILFLTECRIRMSKVVVVVGWTLAWGVGLACVYGLYDHANGEHLSFEESAWYNALHRIGWGMAVCWVIIACATGYGGFVDTILSWKAFVPLSRLTYCAYLVHPPVIYYCFFQQRHLLYLDNDNMSFIFVGIWVMSLAVGFVASMAFEAPFLGLEKVILGPLGNAVKRSANYIVGRDVSKEKEAYSKV